MNPLEQLKKLHSDALTRLSEHPDFQLIKELEPIIAALQTAQEEAAAPEQEPVVEEVLVEDEVDAAEMEVSPALEGDSTANEIAAGAIAAAGATVIAAEASDSFENEEASVEDESEADIDEAVDFAPEVEEIADAEPATPAVEVDAVEPEAIEQALETIAMPEVEASTSAAAPEVTLETTTEPVEEQPTVEIAASEFETEEAFIGSIDDELTQALSGTDFAAEVEASVAESVQSPAPTVDAEPQSDAPAVSVESETTNTSTTEETSLSDDAIAAEVQSSLEGELSIEALIDEQVAKLLSEERPV